MLSAHGGLRIGNQIFCLEHALKIQKKILETKQIMMYIQLLADYKHVFLVKKRHKTREVERNNFSFFMIFITSSLVEIKKYKYKFVLSIKFKML